jgi:hypothetical protein
MTIYKSTKRVLAGVAICFVATTTFLAVAGRGSRPSQAPARQTTQVDDDALKLRQALERGGLREAAKIKGAYVADYDPHYDCGQFSVEDLTKNSAAVIVGRFTKKLDARLLDGKAIFTDYEVTVEELVKGDLKQATTITVSIPGGRFYFEDGTSAEHLTPTFEQPRTGRTYTIFLTTETAVPGVFFLSGGPQGLFDIEGSSGVKSHGRPGDPGAVATKGKDRESFLKEVRDDARKWPKPGKCCG